VPTVCLLEPPRARQAATPVPARISPVLQEDWRTAELPWRRYLSPTDREAGSNSSALRTAARAHARPLGLSVGVVGKFSQPVILHSQDDLPDERDTPSAFPSHLSKVEIGALERKVLVNYFPCFVGTQGALPTRSHRLRRRSPSAGYASIRSLDPLVFTQGFTVAAKSLIKNGKLVGEVELRTAELGTEITLLVLVID
jgi:hypothetical protein